MKKLPLVSLVSIAAFALVAPTISISPTSINFGNQPINTSSDPRTVTVSNTGNSALTVTEITLTGAGVAHFLVSGLPSLPATVAAGNNFTFQAAFRPTTTGPKVATINIKSDDPARPTIGVVMSGTGVAPDITVNPTLVSFGNQCFNVESPARTITISNDGAGILNVTAIILGGVNPGEFLLKDLPSLPTPVPAGTSLSIQVALHPTSTGTKSATITIASDDPDEPTVAALLSGRGTVQSIQVTPSIIDFGSQSILKPPSTSSQVEIRNTDATCPLTITAITLAGANPDDFVVNNDPSLPMIVAPATKVTLEVAFQPKTTGSKLATLTIANDDPLRPTASVTLSGRGVAPDIELTPGSRDFGEQCLTTESAPQSITVTNAGAAPLTVTGITSSTPDFVLGGVPTLPKVVAPGANFAFMVSFRPMTFRLNLESITVASDDPDEPTATVLVSGKGIGPEIDVNPAVLSFGDQLINAANPSRIEVIVKNIHASCKLTVTSISLGGSAPNDYALSGTPSLPKTLNPGDSFTLSVAFQPMTPGYKSATIAIVSNDPLQETFDLLSAGRGVTKLERTLRTLDLRGKAGQTVTAPILLSDTTNLSALQFTLSYNPSVLSLADSQAVTPGLLLPENFTTTANTTTPGVVTVVISPPLMQPIPPLRPGGGSIVNITFQIASDALAGATSLLLLSSVAASDAEANPISLMPQHGAFSVGAPTRLLGVGAQRGGAGTTVTVPVVLSDASMISSLQFMMSFDPTVLSLSATDGVTPGPLVPSGFSLSVSTPGSGQVRVAISAPPMILPPAFDSGNGVVAHMKFQINQTANNAAASLFMLSNILASDSSGNAVDVAPQNGSLTVDALRRGDVNRDGTTNVQDVIRLMQHLNGTKPLTGAGLQEADLTGDGQVNMQDLVRLIELLQK